MKLLFDHNLSPHLVALLADVFPDSQHVASLRLNQAADADIWLYAEVNGYTLVSKDSDFISRSLLFGAPPKFICVRLGNCSTAAVEQVIRSNLDLIAVLEESNSNSCLVLSP